MVYFVINLHLLVDKAAHLWHDYNYQLLPIRICRKTWKRIPRKTWKNRGGLMGFADALHFELLRQKKMTTTYPKILDDAPDGHLLIRSRRKGKTYYWVHHNQNGTSSQLNITGQRDLIAKLVNKMIKRKILIRAKNNVKYMELLQKEFSDVDPSEVLKSCPKKYQDAALMLRQQNVERRMLEPYSKAPFDPRYHIHETDCGIMVRSKSEQITCNTFTAYGIPFHYEEEFVHKEGGRKIYTDFRIFLPADVFYIWEHLGLLSDLKYCERNVWKLHVFQKSGLVLGADLILTMDDSDGTISSSILNKIIETQILPALQGVRVSKELIMAANGVRR